MFRDANDLFRSGIYTTALRRYREAAAAGLDTPVLHYNTAVVAYKLGRYVSAEESFKRAQASPELAAIATYNLGLTYGRLGRAGDAEAAFRLAASASSNRQLADLAERAARTFAPQPERTLRDRRDRLSRTAPEPEGGFRLLMSARYGQDDNIYRTPANPYVDLGAPGQPLVTPVVESSAFIPVDILAQYTLQNEARDTMFLFGYRLDADYYESEFSNADRISQRLEVGADIDVVGENRRRRLQSAFYLTTHYESNFDPDDGFDREIDGEDISERFIYRGAGVEADYSHTLGRWMYGFEVRFEGRQYQRVPLVPSYDHNLQFARARLAYSLGSKTTLNLGILKYARAYDERLARDANGDFLTSNGFLEYDYSGVEIGVSYKPVRAVELSVDYLQLDRQDGFVGYYDNTQDRLRLKLNYRPNPRLQLSFAATSRVYDYPNAFAFDNPSAGPLELDDVGAEIRGEFQITQRLSAWAQLITEDVASTDPRLEYARARSNLGVLWRL